MIQNAKKIGPLIICLVILSILSSCASANPMTKRVAIDVEDELNISERGFRFFVSKDITLERLDFDVTVNIRETVIREETRRTRISLSRTTPGRLQTFDINGTFNVAFESGRNPPTLSFIQNRGTDNYDRYYLNWAVDWLTGEWVIEPVTGKRVIIYDDEAFLVDYRGDEEPYLQYRRTTIARSSTRRMRGRR